MHARTFQGQMCLCTLASVVRDAQAALGTHSGDQGPSERPS